MTVEEANKLLAIAKANYSYAFRNMSKEEKIILVKSWAFVLQDIPADIVTLAFMQLMATSKWLPTPAEIREQVKKLYFSAAHHGLFEENGVSDEQADRVCAYIRANTGHLRGDGSAELSLETILQRGYGRSLGTGKSEFQAIEGNEKYLSSREDKDNE
jgi:hypothetical protein